MELYASAVKREQAKLLKKLTKPKERKGTLLSNSDSDSSMSVQVISAPKTKCYVKTKIQKSTLLADPLNEEAKYQKKVKWLKDHGNPNTDAPLE